LNWAREFVARTPAGFVSVAAAVPGSVPGAVTEAAAGNGPGRPSSLIAAFRLCRCGLTMTRTTFDHEGKPVEHRSHAYLADRYSFKMTLISQ
jgi:hypothetical protein